jgi:excisionase family DNA binding protein
MSSAPLPSARANLPALAQASVTPLAVSPREASRLLSIGISHLYALMRAGELDNFHCGRARRIPIQSIQEYVARRLAIGNNAPGRPASIANTPPRRRRERV